MIADVPLNQNAIQPSQAVMDVWWWWAAHAKNCMVCLGQKWNRARSAGHWCLGNLKSHQEKLEAVYFLERDYVEDVA